MCFYVHQGRGVVSERERERVCMSVKAGRRKCKQYNAIMVE